MSATLTACGSMEPITLTPALEKADYVAATCPKTRSRFHVAVVEDRRGYADPNNIGFTQTGAFNLKTSLLSQPPPVDLLRETLSGLLARCGNLAPEAEADLILRPLLLSFQVTEETGVAIEQITASLRYETAAVPSTTNRRIGRFTVAGEATMSGIADMTDNATKVVAQALRESLRDFAGELGQYQ